MEPTKLARLAGLGAFGAIGGLLALYALVSFISRHTSTGGMTTSLSWVVWISLGVVFAALIGLHIVLGKQLIALSKERPTT